MCDESVAAVRLRFARCFTPADIQKLR